MYLIRILTVLVLVCMIAIGANDIICPDNRCECAYEHDSVIITCPPRNVGIRFRLKYDRMPANLAIDCFSERNLKADMFEMFNLTNINVLRITQCMTPVYSTYSEILRGINPKELHVSPYSASPVLNATLYSNLTRLELLNLDANGFRGIFDGTKFTNNTNLTKVLLSNNYFNNIPDDVFSNLTNLRHLDLASNNITEIRSKHFTSLSNLVNLTLARNHLGAISEGAFSNLRNLRQLILSNNALTSIPMQLFSFLENLTVIDLSANEFLTLPDNIFRNNTKLAKVYISRNKKLTAMSKDLFAAAPLTILDLSQNNLTEIHSDLLKGQIELQQLDLSANNLRSIPVGLFEITRKLNVLNMSHNYIEKIEKGSLNSLTNLVELDFRVNNLVSVTTEFANLVNVKLVNFAQNRIQMIDRMAFVNCTALEHLIFKYNYIGMSELYPPFSIPKNLLSLDLSYNLITTVSEVWVLNSESLATIDLSHNRIKLYTVPKNPILMHDVQLDLSHNEIRTVLVVDGTVSYQSNTGRRKPNMQVALTVVIYGNPIMCDCHLLSFVQYLKLLNYNNDVAVKFQARNLLCSFPEMFVNRYVNALNENHLMCAVPEQCIQECTCLQQAIDKSVAVECKKAKLTNFPSIAPANTTVLRLNDNNIKSIIDVADFMWRNVTILSLSGNLIEELEPVKFPPYLRSLELDSNKIRVFPKWMMDYVDDQSDFTITLGHNDWRCDCDTIVFRDWLSVNAPKISDLNSIACRSGNLKNVHVMVASDSALCPSQPLKWSAVVLIILVVLCCSVGVFLLANIIVKRWCYKHNVWTLRDAFCVGKHRDDEEEHPL